MIAGIAMFNTYSGNYEDSSEAVLLKTAFLSTAEDIVASYLGFDPKQQEYTDIVCSGTGSRRLYLRARNITSVGALTVGTASVDTTQVKAYDDYISFIDHATKFPIGEDNIIVSYTAGWDMQEMPSVIVVSILRIATLMLSETGGNIGLTGKSFADNSRTFVNYSNYRKYLQPLDSMRILGF
ncbi:hypothetical protein SDC9_92736 [bioreactor metagenome]|uniref:Uncharacterized protein n=1 Tax=bioreactor metagenome TaxID=1076179 RepID=A0A644ZYX3_9ZZZZ